MAVIAHVVIRNTTKAQYDEVREKAGWLEDAPAGGIAHLTWWEGDDCHNMDAWDSEEDLNAFVEARLGSAMAAAGVTSPPEFTFHEPHEVFVPNTRLIKAT